MPLLDLEKLHHGLESEFGLDATYLGGQTHTAFIYLASSDGLPMNVGWFNNRAKSGLRADTYALTTHPTDATTIDYRIMVEQTNPRGVGQLKFVDEFEYMEGLADVPFAETVPLLQPTLDRTLRELTLGSFVLDSNVGNLFSSFT